MSFLRVDNVEIKAIASCVPKNRVENSANPVFNTPEEASKFIEVTSIKTIHTASGNVTASDLCLEAANKIVADLNWDKESIDCLIFVSQTPDYILPATSCLLQQKLGLSQECFALDISLGCSGWVYGLSVISSMMSSGSFKRGLLLCGDTISRLCSPLDKSTVPLFGDAGTATAVEFKDGATPLKFHFNTDGSGSEAIMIPGGAMRNPFNNTSLELEPDKDDPSIKRNELQLYLNGMDVFSFGISKVPKSVRSLLDENDIAAEDIDYYVFHQANGMMNEKIRKKLKLPAEKVPLSLERYGNTSVASIPLTICSEMSGKTQGILKFLACGFGVGLAWGSVYFETNNLLCSRIVEL